MTHDAHEYTVPLYPTHDQARALDALAELAHRVECAVVQQARCGMTPSLTALLGGMDHSERGDGAEILALSALPGLAAAPLGLLEQAVRGRRARIRSGDLTAPQRPTPVVGEGLIVPATPGGLLFNGVPGVIEVGIDCLPPWAAQVWRHAAGGSMPTLDPRLGIATVDGWAYIERGDYAGTPGWLVDLSLDWDAYPTWQLKRDGDEWDNEPWRRAVRHLMV